MKLTFFPVSTQKFMVLSVATFGIYPVYWFYQNWRRIRSAGARVSPLLRAGFAPIFGTALLNRIKERAEEDQIAVGWSPVLLGTAFLIVSVLAALPDPWWLLSIGIFTPMLAPLETTMQINQAAGHPDGLNDEYTAGNVATIVIGALVWVLLIVALLIGPPPVPSA